MEEEKKTVVTTQEIEEKMEESKMEQVKEDGPEFAPLSAQDLAVSIFEFFLKTRVPKRFVVFAVLPTDSYPYHPFSFH